MWIDDMSDIEDKNTVVINDYKNDFFFDLSNSSFEHNLYVQFFKSISLWRNCVAQIGDVVISLPKFLDTQEFDSYFLGCNDLTITREDSISIFTQCVMSAKINSRGLYVVRELIDVDLGALIKLIQIQSEDPYIGLIQPRFSSGYTDEIYLLPSNLKYKNSTFNKECLRFLPKKMLSSEFISPIIFLTKNAVRMGEVRQFYNFDDVLLDFATGIRRQGFRNQINCNVIQPIFNIDSNVYKNWSNNPSLDEELKQAREFLIGNPEHDLELILKGGIENQGRIQYKLLLDCRGVSSHINGSSEAVMGYLEGISNAAIDCLDITVIMHDDAAKFHNLSKRFENFKITTEFSNETYMVSLILGQLWSIEILKELHCRSVFLSCVMFDTISWDIIYPTTSKRNSFWRVMPNLIDTIFFISSFSKHRFNYRFPVSNPCRNVVSHLTTNKSVDVSSVGVRRCIDERYIFIMGNSLDHKRVDLTVKLILNSFPTLKIVKIGGGNFDSDSVVKLDSGNLPEHELIKYMSEAELVIYPSCYEGFGLPVVESLLLNKPTLVQESDLWNEMASLVMEDPNLIQFSTYLDLIEKVGQIFLVEKNRLAKEQPINSKPLLKSHKESVESMLDECLELIYLANCDRWIYRQNIINSFR